MASNIFVFLAVCGLRVGDSLDVEMHQSKTDVQIGLASIGSMIGQRKAAKMRREHQAKEMVRKFDQNLLDGDVSKHTEQPSTTWKLATVSTTTGPPSISCGGHMAAKCSLCTVIDPNTGAEIADQGPEWCHGHCTYYDGECHSMNAYNMKKRDAYTLDATTTRSIPDLLNPDITEEDKKIMEIAARRGLEESNYESEQKLSNEHEKREKKRDTTNKFIYYAIMGCSGCLACCACFAVVVCILGMQRKKKGASLTSNDDVQEERKKDDDGQAVEDDGEG